MDVPGDSGVLPGAGFNFQDVTNIFSNVAAGMSPEPKMSGITSQMQKEMEPGDFVFMEDFTLHDAMGAFEVRRASIACVGFADTPHDWGATPRQWPDP